MHLLCLAMQHHDVRQTPFKPLFLAAEWPSLLPVPARMHRKVVCKAGRGGAIGLPMHTYCRVSCHTELWTPLTDKVELRDDRKVSVESSP